MKVVALISGGKDSCYAMQLAQQAGHELVALANLLPPPESPDDLHSYMYQTVSARIGLLCWALRLSHLVCASKRLLPWLTQVGHQLVEAYAACTAGAPASDRHGVVYCPPNPYTRYACLCQSHHITLSCGVVGLRGAAHGVLLCLFTHA